MVCIMLASNRRFVVFLSKNELTVQCLIFGCCDACKYSDPSFKFHIGWRDSKLPCLLWTSNMDGVGLGTFLAELKPRPPTAQKDQFLIWSCNVYFVLWNNTKYNQKLKKTNFWFQVQMCILYCGITQNTTKSSKRPIFDFKFQCVFCIAN